jgi:glycosyltransferase involved in cell wall biosynthesis
MKKVRNLNLIAGGTWNLPSISNLFSNFLDSSRKRLITSIPNNNYKKNNFKTTIVPKYFQIIEKFFRVKFNKKFTRWDDAQFAYLASNFIKNGDVAWGLQGFLYNTILKNKNGLNIVDRSCPHMFKQEQIKKNECKKLGVRYEKKPDWLIKKIIFEYDKSDFIAVPSEMTKKSFLEYGYDDNKIIKIPILGNSRKIQPTLKRIEKKITFGCLGGDLTRKGIYYVIKAWLKTKPHNAELVIKTSSEQINKSSELKKIIKDLKNVRYVNYFPDISDFFNNIDVFIFASSDDGFGMALTDAMNFKKFSIVSNNVGASEYIVEGITGYKYDYNDVEHMCSIISDICVNPNILENVDTSSYFKLLNKEIQKANPFIAKVKNFING